MKKYIKSQKRKLHLMAVNKKSIKSKKRHNKLVKFFNMYRNNVSEESKQMAKNEYLKAVYGVKNKASDSPSIVEKEKEIIPEVKEKKTRKKGSVIIQESEKF